MKRSRTLTNLILLIGFAVLSIGGMEFLAVNIGQPSPLGSSNYTVRAVFPDADGIPTAADVRISGVAVGKVTGVDHDPSAPGYTVVTMTITDTTAVPVYTNGTATVRPKTLLGEKYVDLRVGDRSAEQVANGGTMPIGQATAGVSNDQIFNSFDATTRAQQQQVLQDLDKALKGHAGDIRTSLPQLQQVVTDLRPVAQAYSQDQPEVDRILVNLNTILRITADEHEQIGALLRNGGVALNAVASRDQQLIQTLQSASNVASEINAAAAPTVADQRQAIADLAPTVQSTNALLDQIVGPQAACGNKPCGLDQVITETFTGNINYPNDQLNVTNSSGNAVTNEWDSMFSSPTDAQRSGGATHAALNLVLSEHCDSLAQTLAQIVPNLPPTQQTYIQTLCQTAVGHSGSSGTGSPVPPAISALPQLPAIVPNPLLDNSPLRGGAS